MVKASPIVILLSLILLGTGVGVFVSQKSPVPTKMEAIEEPEDLQAQLKLMEGQVEYLQGQVGALQEENAQLLQKLGTLGMKGIPKMEPAVANEDEDMTPDYVGMGLDMMKFRQIQALPIPTVGATQAEVEKAILTWMRQQQPNDDENCHLPLPRANPSRDFKPLFFHHRE